MSQKLDDIVDILKKKSKAEYGFICLNKVMSERSKEELQNFSESNNIKIHTQIFTKTGYLLNLASHYYNQYKDDPDLNEQYEHPLQYMGEMIFKDKNFHNKLYDFDIISRYELMGIFGDFCADLGISAFDASGVEEYQLDQYLTRKTPILRTEAVVVRSGVDLLEDEYEECLSILEKAKTISSWLVFVTTPYGVYRIGLNRLVNDMEELNAWTYVVDPVTKTIYGITKGKKNKEYDEDLRDVYMQKLPQNSMRSPSQVVKISNYKFEEGDTLSYKTSDFSTYQIYCEEDFKNLLVQSAQKEPEVPKYREIFSNLIVIDMVSGIAIIKYSKGTDAAKEDLISSFLTAMDSFVSELGGTDTLQEINYQGFYIQAAYANLIKIALFLSKPSDRILRERLEFFINYLERKYFEKIRKFRNTGQVSMFDMGEFAKEAERFLEI